MHYNNIIKIILKYALKTAVKIANKKNLFF